MGNKLARLFKRDPPNFEFEQTWSPSYLPPSPQPYSYDQSPITWSPPPSPQPYNFHDHYSYNKSSLDENASPPSSPDTLLNYRIGDSYDKRNSTWSTSPQPYSYNKSSLDENTSPPSSPDTITRRSPPSSPDTILNYPISDSYDKRNSTRLTSPQPYSYNKSSLAENASPPSSPDTILNYRISDSYDERNSTLLTSPNPLSPDRQTLVGSCDSYDERNSISPQSEPLIWLWKDDDELYSPYMASVSKLLTERYRSTNCCDSCDFTINSHQYRVYFEETKPYQVNLFTCQSRSVLVGQLSTAVHWHYLGDLGHYYAYTSLESAAIEACYQAGQSSVRLVINGNRYVVNTKLMYQVNVKTAHKRQVMRVPANNPPLLTQDSPALYSGTHDSPFSSPFQNIKPTLVSVKRFSPEWRHVSEKMEESLPNATIVSIHRVQNRLQWERYEDCMKRLRKTHGNVNDMELFHGTSDADPTKIYLQDQGFNIQFSKVGLWGTATYFAVNASYSHNYAFRVKGSNDREFFLVKVLTGYSCEMEQDKSLKCPPDLPANLLRHSNGQSQYDTVTGITGGSRVYMTYDNYHAYPAYLIKYYVQ